MTFKKRRFSKPKLLLIAAGEMYDKNEIDIDQYAFLVDRIEADFVAGNKMVDKQEVSDILEGYLRLA